MHSSHRRLVLLAFVFLCLATTAGHAQYPIKPVKILAPYAPGGAADVVVRVIGDQLRQIFGQAFVVENKPGAFGIIAIEEMGRARPLMVGNVTSNVITPLLFPKKLTINYTRDIVPVVRISDLPSFVIVTARDFPPTTLQELIAYAKQRPGKVRFGSTGVGSFPHFDMEIFARRAALELAHIPNKAGAAGMLNDLVSGDAQVAFINVATTAPLIRAGQLRALAVVAQARLAEYPDVPTLAELGYPGVGTLQWLAMFAPAATPRDVREKLHGAVVQALESARAKEAFRVAIMRAIPTASPDDAKTWLESEMAAWSKIIAEVKIELTD